MDVRILSEPQQGACYDDMLAAAKLAEDAGFAGFFRSDHYLRMGTASGLPGPTDAWVTLAGLARETTRVRLGTLVSPATFRHPAVLAISVAQIDQMSGGRVELGLGAGWYAEEHEAYGIPLDDAGRRFDVFTEQLAVVTGLWKTPPGETYSFHGTHYRLVDSPALPKPFQRPRPPVIIGGRGKRRTPELAAAYADEFNLAFAEVGTAPEHFERVDAAARRIGRRPDTIVRSVSLLPAVGRTPAESARRVDRLRRQLPKIPVGQLPDHMPTGSPAELVDRIGRYESIGVSRVYLDLFDLSDLDQIELIAAEALPQLG
ncbi:LLM class F420-dependent oxidoreductase [Jiangella alkaliphila]|nr:LLM class F420-dependent oxidoreductase [Jiangella alkaliphila]